MVFYNGTDAQPDELILQLSDSFPESKKSFSDIEVRVRMININYGHNKELLAACRPLKEYSWLVDEIRQNQAAGKDVGMDVERGVKKGASRNLLTCAVRMGKKNLTSSRS